MSIIKLTDEQKNKIISDCINTNKNFKRIARENHINLEDVYAVMNEYCKKNNYVTFRRTRTGVIFEKEDGTIIEIADNKVVTTPKDKNHNKSTNKRKIISISELTEEQKNKIIDECIYTKRPFNSIGRKNNIEPKDLYAIMNEYCRKNNYKLFKRTKSSAIFKTEDGRIIEITKDKIIVTKFNKNNNSNERVSVIERTRARSLKNAQEIERWSEKKGRKPRVTIEGVKVAKKGEQETEEQHELRLGQAFNNIKTNIMKEYEGKELEEIEDEETREIVRIIRNIDNKYEVNKKVETKRRKVNFVKTLGNEKMSKMIVKLVETRNATEEQIRAIAEFYGVDLEKVKNIQEER